MEPGALLTPPALEAGQVQAALSDLHITFAPKDWANPALPHLAQSLSGGGGTPQRSAPSHPRPTGDAPSTQSGTEPPLAHPPQPRQASTECPGTAGSVSDILKTPFFFPT